jgi:hypothetical protein
MGRAVCQGGTIPNLNLYFNSITPLRGGTQTANRGPSRCLTYGDNELSLSVLGGFSSTTTTKVVGSDKLEG